MQILILDEKVVLSDSLKSISDDHCIGVVCLLQFAELPFRHLFQHLDGETTGPRSFGGPIEQSLIGCEKLSEINFQLIDNEIPEMN